MMLFLLLLLPTVVFHFSLQTYAIILSKRMKVLISWWKRVCNLVSFAVRVWVAYSLTGNIAFVRKTRRNKCSTCCWAIIKEIGARSPVPASRGAKERRRKRGFMTTPSTLFVVWNNAVSPIGHMSSERSNPERNNGGDSFRNSLRSRAERTCKTKHESWFQEMETDRM